jgi:phytanoyl-CoA hydroxylase
VISDAQVDFFWENGFVAVDDVLTRDQLELARSIVDDFVERSRSVRENDDVYDLEPDHSPEQPHVRGLKDPLRAHPLFGEILVSDAVLDVVERLIGPDLRWDLIFMNIKPPRGGSALEWHQDFAILPYTNDDLVVCGVAIDDCTAENGCLEVVPGSHRGPILDHHQDGVMIGAIQADDPDLRLDDAVPLEVGAGGMTIHHFRTSHASGPNNSDISRRVLFLDYAAVDAYPVGKKVDLDEFDSRLVRGTCERVARLAPLSFKMPNRKVKANILFHLQATTKKRMFEKA